MKVLSLFDGMSCGQIALKQLGIISEVYYASEVDKHAIKQTQLNFPNTIQLGDVTQVDVSQLEPIDLLIGGSPCQSLSFAGKRVGMSTIDKEEIYTLNRYLELKEEGFQFEGESYLFWEYMRILTDIRKYNPNVLFLLENVEMGKKWERVLSEAIGVYGVHINSALVSAQNRRRIYWTNIQTRRDGLFGELHSDIPQPVDKGILLKDILEDEVDDKFFLSDKMVSCLASRKETETFSPCKFEPFELPYEVKCRTINQRVHKMGDADKYLNVEDVLAKKRFINGPTGAACTFELKKQVRYKLEKELGSWDGQVWGFDFDPKEINRAIRFKQQYPDTKPLFPLIEKQITKQDAMGMLWKAGIEIPAMYKMGYNNNNCIGCVKGGMVITIKGDTIEFYGGTLTYEIFGKRSINSIVTYEPKEKGD